MSVNLENSTIQHPVGGVMEEEAAEVFRDEFWWAVRNPEPLTPDLIDEAHILASDLGHIICGNHEPKTTAEWLDISDRTYEILNKLTQSLWYYGGVENRD